MSGWLKQLRCRVLGHKTYEHVRVEYPHFHLWVWTRCKRCGLGLSKRPARDDEGGGWYIASGRDDRPRGQA